MSDVDYIALAFEPHGNVTMRQLRRAALREREAKDVLAARLAEVEAERDGVSMQNDLAGEQLREMAAERDRLAQEHDELLAEFHEYAEHQSWRCGHAPHYYLVGGEALESCPCGLDEVLARFPLATEKAEQASETAAREAVDGA